MALKRTELKRKTPLRRGISRLNPIAKRKRSQHRKDSKWRQDYLLDHPWCEIGPVLFEAALNENLHAGRVAAIWLTMRPCQRLAVELHERIKRGRGGSTTDEKNVIPACRNCHDFTEHEVKASTVLGLLASRGKRVD